MRKVKFDKILTKLFLQKYYIKKKMNTYQIAKIVECSAHTITDYLHKYQIKTRNNEDKNNGNYIDGRSKRIFYCKELGCNNQVCTITYFKGQGRCNSCANKGENNSMFGKKGKLAPSYIHGQGYEPYSIGFNKQIKLHIRERDNFECQICHITEEEHIIVYGRVLEVHHIDYDKENCKEDNLITTCKQCNIRANYNRKYWKKYLGELICR